MSDTVTLNRTSVLLLAGVTMLSIAASALAVRDFRRSQDLTRKLYGQVERNLDTVASLEYQAQEARRRMLYALATADSDAQLRDVQRSRAAGTAASRLLGAIAPGGSSEVSRAIARAGTDWQTYLDERDEVIGLMLEGDHIGAVARDQRDAERAFQRVRDDLRVLNAAFAAQSGGTLDDIQAISTTSLYKLLTLLAVTQLLSIFGYRQIQKNAVIEEMRVATRAAQDAAAAKAQFLSNMSHEIRTPLNAVIGMSQLLDETPLTAEQREFAETIRTAGDTLLAVVNDILDYSKIEAGRLEPEQAPYDPRETCAEALDLVAQAAGRKGLELAFVPGAAVPDSVVGDRARLKQVVLNLLSNAVKFTPAGEVVLSISGTQDAGGRPELRVSVRDTGIGISKEAQGRLFDAFTQADGSTTRLFGGTGLGLVISRRLAELMGGTLTMTSAQGEGSTFLLHLPCTAAASAADEAGIAPWLQGKRLLIVDDNGTSAGALRASAERWGLVPDVCRDGLAALAYLSEGAIPDAAVIDMLMPGMDGVELGRQIRARDASRDLPMVLLSPYGTQVPRAAGELAFAAVLTEPLRPLRLHRVLAEALEGPRPFEPRVAPAQASAGVSPAGGPIDHPVGVVPAPLRVLLAEDNAVNQLVAVKMLEKMGCQVETAWNGQETLDRLERSQYDLLLLDLHMPVMDGFETVRAIRLRWPIDRPRIVALTASALEADRQSCLDAGMDDFLAKPFRREALIAVLESAPRHTTPSGAGSRRATG